MRILENIQKTGVLIFEIVYFMMEFSGVNFIFLPSKVHKYNKSIYITTWATSIYIQFIYKYIAFAVKDLHPLRATPFPFHTFHFTIRFEHTKKSTEKENTKKKRNGNEKLYPCCLSLDCNVFFCSFPILISKSCRIAQLYLSTF